MTFCIVHSVCWSTQPGMTLKISYGIAAFLRHVATAKELLQEMDLTDYDPLKIVEKTRGRLADDEMWLRLRYLPRKEIIYASH